MKNILKLSLIVLLTIFSINISFAWLVMPDSYSKKWERISFSFNWEWNEKLSYKSVNFKNLWNNWIWFFYNQSNGYNYCIVKTEKIENCEYLYDTEWYIYKKNDNLYFNENENIFWPYKEKEEIIKNLENISSIYKKNNDKKKKENIDKENTNVDFISDENNNNYFKFNWEIIWPYKDFEKINNNNFRYKILDSYYAYLDWKFIWPYISLHLKDYWINWIWISYLVNWTYNTWDRYIELKWKKYWPIKNDDFKDKYNFINLGINWIGNIYKKNDKSYYSVNWIEYWPYDIINKMYDLWKSWIWVIYWKKHNDKIIYWTSPVEYKSFLNINWKEYWPFMYQYYETKFQDLWENWFAFIYRGLDTTKWEYYANINWKVYWPYESIPIIIALVIWQYLQKRKKSMDRWLLYRIY